MKIQKLPAEARSKLQSGIIVTDAAQCVLELVHNSLDADATGIAVRVDLKTYQIRVIDNGKGIGKDDLEFVGERFMTSKYHSQVEMEASFPTYGFRGQALSSLQDVSRTLTIESKSEEEGVAFVKVFKNNKALPITKTDSDRHGTGTIVTVDDFLYTMPVRRNRINEVFDMEEIKSQLQYLAVIHYNVCFTLRNENKGLILLQTPQASSILESVTNIYGKTVAKSLKALYYDDKKYEITGFISLRPQTQGNLQLLYINKRIVSKCVIHKFVNKLIKEYSGKKSLLGYSPTGQILKRLKSIHNIFIIQIRCPHFYYELFTNGRKVTVEFRNWKEPLKFIHKAVKRAFKGALNLVSSTNTQVQQHGEKNKTENNKTGRGVFGTSLLVNAVRGAAAKRVHSKGAKNRKKMKFNTSKEKFDALLADNTKNIHGKVVENLDTSVDQNECWNDTLESPIPKKIYKSVKQGCHSKLNKTDVNQSFVEFYEWLKAKFETDMQAFNLYNNFLHFKNRTIYSDEAIQFKSPVLGVKPKRKQAPKMTKKTPEKKPKMPSNDISLLDEEIAIVTQRQLKIYPNQHLRMKQAVKFTAEMNTDIHESCNFGYFPRENDKFDIPSSFQFKKPVCLPGFRTKERQIEYNHSLHSLPSSELQFTNVIKFRNLSESFFQNSVDGHMLPEKTFSVSNTWVSHYQETKNCGIGGEYHGKKPKGGSFIPWLKANEMVETPQRNKRNWNFEDFDNISTSDARLINNKREKTIFRNVEVQVNILTPPVQKVNAMVQTTQEVPESPSFENSYVFSPGGAIPTTEKTKANLEEIDKIQFSYANFSPEVPNPDFWNSTNHLQFEVYKQNELVANEVASNKSSNDITNKKNLTSNEFVCGHKSQLSTKVESTSKETQTIAAIWTDSLTELNGNAAENTNTGAHHLMNSKSEGAEFSDPNTIPNTLPIEEIECGMTEAGFCVTERHDFIPKGLSPKFLNSKATVIAPLSPSERDKIQLTIDNAQNEFLATIKWQNESTGDCLKPIIPDAIIFEMRRKAGENLTDYENPVLSATLSYCALKVHNLLHSFSFSKELLSGVEVLGQLDKKFIVTKMKISAPKKMALISLFDQHAVDERINLEKLIDENISSCGKFVSSPLNTPVECTLTESDARVVCDLKEKMLRYGLKAEPVSTNTVIVSEVPTFLVKKNSNGLKNKKETRLTDAVRALILNIIEEVMETRGVGSKIPKVMHDAFCLDACHKAIKFNKQLSAEDMTEMIMKLQNCELPFQCAHGRPSVIPIIDLEDFKPSMEENETISLEKLRKFLNERKESSVENSQTA